MPLMQNTPVIILPRNNTSLRPLAEDSDKLLLNIGDRPLIYHNLKMLADSGMRHVFLPIQSDNEFLKAYLQTVRLPGLTIRTCTVDDNLGEIEVLSNLQRAIGGRRFFVLTTDVLLHNDLTDFYNTHMRLKKMVSAGIRQLPFDTRLSDAIFIANLVEQQNINPYNYDWHHYACGLFLFENEIFDELTFNKKEQTLAAFLFSYLTKSNFMHLEDVEYLCREIRNLDDFMHANFNWVRRCYSTKKQQFINAGDRESPLCVGEVYIDAQARVSAKAVLIGPVVIGRGCKIADGAVVQRSVLRGNVTIGRHVVLQDCIVNRDANIPADTRHSSKLILDDSLNLRLDDFKQVSGVLKNYPPHLGQKRDMLFPTRQKRLNITV